MSAVSIKIRKARMSDIPELLELEKLAWGEEKAATEEMFKSRIKTFSEGTLVALLREEIVGVVSTEIINYDGKAESWYKITDNGLIAKTHNSEGDTIYGVDISVHPSYQRKGIGKKLMECIGKLAIRCNLRQGMLGCRIPDYHKFARDIKAEDYIKIIDQKGKRYIPQDPELSFFLKLGLRIYKLVPNYFKDPESLNYGVLLVWENPFYNKWYRWIAAKIFRV